MTSDAQTILQSWSTPIGVNVALFLTVLVYVRGWFRLRTISPNLIPPWRLAAFISGIVAVWIAIGSPVDAFDDVLLSVHMVQHLLLMAIAPPLILLGAPALPLLKGLPQWFPRGVVSPFLQWRWVKWLGHFLAGPAVCWLAATLALIGWHIPAVFELALRRSWFHELEHACFLGTGLLFWWPVVQPWPSIARWPRWSIPLYLFFATLPCDALSGFLAFCDRVVYPSYQFAPRVFSISAIQDQECAAALMWACVTIIFLVPAVIVTLQLLSPQRAPLPQETFAQLSGVRVQPFPASKMNIV